MGRDGRHKAAPVTPGRADAGRRRGVTLRAAAHGRTASLMRIAYLASRYPAVSHTFIQREIAGLRDQGVTIDTFAIRRAQPDEVLSRAGQPKPKSRAKPKAATANA